MHMNPTPIQIAGAAIFAIAVLHTFSTKYFGYLAHSNARHAGIWHLLSEVEVVFGFWAMVMMVWMFSLEGKEVATHYLDTRNFTEPMFVFAIMVIAGSRPILQVALQSARLLSRLLPLPSNVAFYVTIMALVPLMGSFLTEAAAMTLAALILRDRFFRNGLSPNLQYATLGVLFVNVSIGGTLTPFAAPPILMVAGTWQWDMTFMASTFGWKAAIAVFVNAILLTVLFRRELAALPSEERPGEGAHTPFPLVAIHLFFLAGVVVFAHHPAIFMGLFLFFLGVAHAYERYQNRLILREGLLVAFFLAGLEVLGGQQQWWLQPVLSQLSDRAVFFGTTLLTAFTDNAALTYLGSLVNGLSDPFKYALVAGAVTGGGLTVIANAPNPAGLALLRNYFEEESVSPAKLALAALPPTIIAAAAFLLL